MVVFTCNACGESVKKGQVEKHVNICRNCQCLSCMDCGKDFWGDDYKSHVKCVSEDQKYGGKGYELKINKGDAKQQEWIQKIHEAIKKADINPKVRDILEQMYAYDNIPRKKKKFQNWMSNSLKIHNSSLQDQVWDIFSEATKKETVTNHPAKDEVRPTPAEDNGAVAENSAQEKNKREQQEEKKHNKKTKPNLPDQKGSLALKKNKKSKRAELEDNNGKMSKAKYLKMRKQQQADDSAASEINGSHPDPKMEGSKTNMKKRKLNSSEDEGDCPLNQKRMNKASTEEHEDDHQEVSTDFVGKFNWKGTMKAVLKQMPDHEISLKKLRKKVLSQYYTVVGDNHKSEEEILALFNKKVNNNPKFRVLKGKVKLIK